MQKRNTGLFVNSYLSDEILIGRFKLLVKESMVMAFLKKQDSHIGLFSVGGLRCLIKAERGGYGQVIGSLSNSKSNK